jgi:hypothetical protein
MRPTVFQRAELRDENDNIVQQGTYGKGSALSNSTNDGWVDYVMNNLEALYGIAKDEVVPVSALPASGDMNKTYLLTTTGVCYRWDGTEWVEISSSEAVGRAENAATLAEQWATKTNGTVDGSEYSAKYYANAAQQSANDAQDVADDMATHLVQIDKNTGGVSANSKRIGNIEKLLQGNLYDYDTDDDTAYTKSVPSGAMPYAGLEQIGGKTVVMNQLVDYTSIASSGSRNGKFDWVNNNDGSFTFTGNSSATSGNSITFATIPINHKYAVVGWTNSYHLGIFPNGQPVAETDGIFTQPNNNPLVLRSNTTNLPDNVSITLKPKIADLTLMFGAGNEPSTLDEFLAIYPNFGNEDYNVGTLLSAGVTEVVSKDTNNATLQTYSVPAFIQALEGYGWSAGSVYNYIDFERKVFVQNVGSVDMGTLNWNQHNTYPYVFLATLTNCATGISGKQMCLCDSYTAIGCDTFANFKNTDKTTMICKGNTSVYVSDANYSSASDFKSAMSGVYLYYELATPVETDISQYLTDDNLINVESGGTLTFPNQNGTDYQIPVPSEEEYMIDLQEAINNG